MRIAYACLSLPKSVSLVMFRLHLTVNKRQMAPSALYNYHPLLPRSDPENPSTQEETCSICMDPVDTRPGPSGEVLLGINPRRAYALAPCHHLFHTKCLSQWMAVKVSLAASSGQGRVGLMGTDDLSAVQAEFTASVRSHRDKRLL